jgi:hypothetical protein
MSGVLGASAYGCFVRAFANRRNLAFAANGRAGPGVLGRDNVFRLNKEVARDAFSIEQRGSAGRQATDILSEDIGAFASRHSKRWC